MTPFARISTRVFDHMADLGPSGLAVYVGLAKYADNLTRECFPRQSTLAALLHLPRQSVNAAILRLEACGLIEVERRPGRGHVYRLLDTDPAPSGQRHLHNDITHCFSNALPSGAKVSTPVALNSPPFRGGAGVGVVPAGILATPVSPSPPSPQGGGSLKNNLLRNYVDTFASGGREGGLKLSGSGFATPPLTFRQIQPSSKRSSCGYKPQPAEGANADASAPPPLSAQATGGVCPADNINYTASLTRLKQQLHPPAAPAVVVVPACLRNLDVETLLAPVPAPHRQTLLDAYAARHQWGKLNSAPIALPGAMLRALVKQFNAGTLDTAQAHKIAAQRAIKPPTPAAPAPTSRPSTRDAALTALRGARAALGARMN